MELSEYHKSKLLNDIGEALQQIKKSFAESLKAFKKPNSTPTKEVDIDMKETNNIKECSNQENYVERVELESPQGDMNNTLSGYMTTEDVNTKFLHSNTTTHKWAFRAIAELIDNAIDEIPNSAMHMVMEKIMNQDTPALLIQDNGGGMDPDSVHRCVGLSFCSKDEAKSVGCYDNGFKTSTMRLAMDTIIFTHTLPPYGSLPKLRVALHS